MKEAKPRVAALVIAVMAMTVTTRSLAQEDGPPRSAPVAPATLNKLFTEYQNALAAREYNTSVAKLTELLKLCGNSPEYSVELLMFNLGLANLLGGKAAEAEKAFDECAKKFPKGEYTSRCYLGIGQAAVAQGGDEKRMVAIEALKKAVEDPRYRIEAGQALGQVFIDDNDPDAAMAVFRTLMGTEVRTPQQTSAAVAVIGLLAATDQMDDLVDFLDHLVGQPGVRDFLAWYSNQVVVAGDSMVDSEKFEAALAIYRSVPPRAQILEIQTAALERQRKELDLLKKRQEAEAKNPEAGLSKRSNAGELISTAQAALKLSEQAFAAIGGMKDLDASLLMRRGRCLFYLERHWEALVCFATIREKYPEAQVAEAAAYAEIVIYNELKDNDEIRALAEAFMKKYPDAPNRETVVTLVGGTLVGTGQWPMLQSFYEDAAKHFPKSPNLSRFRFYQAVAVFQQGEFLKAAELLVQWLPDFPKAPRAMKENALYRIAMAYFLENRYAEARYWRLEYIKYRRPQAMLLLRRAIPGCRLAYRPLLEAMLRRAR